MNIPADYEMGLPDDGWTVGIDFQNYSDAVWLGCPLRYFDNGIPASVPFINTDNKNILFDRGIPGAFSGLMKTGRDYYEYFLEKSQTYTFKGIKVTKIDPRFLFHDGPFTVACELRGVTEFCYDLYDDPDYAHQLLNFITEATIYRIKEWRKYLKLPEKNEKLFFADDSILLLSTDMYKEFVLPYHKKLCDALSVQDSSKSIHLCGDATRHFKTIKNELNVKNFDTGFPVKHGELVKELGQDVTIQGGPHIELLRTGKENEIDNEVKRIIEEVKDHTKKFVLRDGNNIAPYTPLSNLKVMYEACKKYGNY